MVPIEETGGDAGEMSTESKMESIRAKLGMGDDHDAPESPGVGDDDSTGEGEGEELAAGEDGDTGESQDVEIRTLQQLAKAIDVDPEFLYGLELSLADGADPVRLGDYKDRLQQAEQRASTADRTRAEIEQERQQVAAFAQSLAQHSKQVDEAEEAAQWAMKSADADYRRIDWEELQKLDPGRAALEQNKLLARYGTAKEQLQQAQAKRQQMQGYAGSQAKAYHDQQLLHHVPDWQDPVKAKAEVEGIVEWSHKTYGFQDNELMQAVDWRHRDILRKAWKYDQIQAGAKGATGKAPKSLSGAATLKVGAAQKAKIKSLVSRAQQTRTKGDKIAAAAAILQNANVR